MGLAIASRAYLWSDAARIGGIGLQIVRDWVMRFNARGPDALIDGKPPGPRSMLRFQTH